MILEVEQIKELILEPANADMIDYARRYAKKLNMHINGIGLDDYIKQINNYENKEQYELRQLYKRSNKALFKNILQPLVKVFHTRGGAKYYNLPENSEKQFKEILSNIKGKSIQQWVEKTWGRKKLTDPTGLIFVEISKDGTDTYPTYKSIHSIYDMQLTGTKPEYVIFEPEETTIKDDDEKDIIIERYRVVDDAWDYIFEKRNEEITLIEDETFPNFYEIVPAVLISAEIDENYGNGMSFIDASLEIANEVVDDNSIKNIFKKMHGFPSYWEYERKCLACHGDGKIKGENCPICGGDGIRRKKDVSDITTVVLDDEGKANPVPPAGYVSPDLETWKQMNDELDYLGKAIHYVTWGTHAIENATGETATGRYLDIDPVHTNLNLVANEAENIEKFITDLMGLFYFGNAYQGSTIIYSRRYQLESPDEILAKLAKMKTENIPENIIRNKYKEYLQAEYSNDPYEMSKQIKLFNLAIYPLYTAKELSGMNIPQEEIFRKLYFTDWTNSINDNDLLFEKEKALINKRDEYINTKISSINLKPQENAEV